MRYLNFIKLQRATRSTKQTNAKQDTPANDNTYLDIDLSMKMFESEILWSAYHLNEGNMEPSQYMNNVFAKINEAVENLKNANVSFHKLNFINNFEKYWSFAYFYSLD